MTAVFQLKACVFRLNIYAIGKKYQKCKIYLTKCKEYYTFANIERPKM